MIEAAESGSLAGRSRHSSEQGGARKPVALRGRTGGYPVGDRGAQPITTEQVESDE